MAVRKCSKGCVFFRRGELLTAVLAPWRDARYMVTNAQGQGTHRATDGSNRGRISRNAPNLRCCGRAVQPSPMRLPSRLRLTLVVAAVLCCAPGAGRLAAASPPLPTPLPAVVASCKGVADGALCTDRNSCTVGDVCFGGVCTGTIVVDGTPCTDENQCTANDLCRTGVCVGMPMADGTPCTDDEVCTDPDTCQGAVCVAGPLLQCDDGDPCTTDTCVLGDGCHYDKMPVCSDAGPDATPDDAGPDDAGPDDAGVDLPPGAGPGEDALDDGGMNMAKVYQARGGACVCTSAGAPRSGTVFGLLVAAVMLSRRRRR